MKVWNFLFQILYFLLLFVRRQVYGFVTTSFIPPSISAHTKMSFPKSSSKIVNPYKTKKRASSTSTTNNESIFGNKNPRISIGSKVPPTDYASFHSSPIDTTLTTKTTYPTTTTVKNALMEDKKVFSKEQWEKALKTYFGYNQFRKEQYEVIDALIHQRRNVAVFWSTGSGKSLCYQLPPLFLSSSSAALVISPLISLMQDQVAKVNGQFDKDKRIAIELSSNSKITTSINDVLETYKLIYCTPETFSSLIVPHISSTTIRDRLCLIAIDECHCVSEWGHDFRPEYQRIGQALQKHLPNIPKLALTATAVPYVQKDILKNLNINDDQSAYISQQSFDRDNLEIHVQRKRPGGYRTNLPPLLSLDKQKSNNNNIPSTIIYCPTRDLVDQITTWLQTQFQEHPNNKVVVQAYHAGMTNEQRMDAHFQFLVGKTQIIVATIAFGMGIGTY